MTLDPKEFQTNYLKAVSKQEKEEREKEEKENSFIIKKVQGNYHFNRIVEFLEQCSNKGFEYVYFIEPPISPTGMYPKPNDNCYLLINNFLGINNNLDLDDLHRYLQIKGFNVDAIERIKSFGDSFFLTFKLDK